MSSWLGRLLLFVLDRTRDPISPVYVEIIDKQGEKWVNRSYLSDVVSVETAVQSISDDLAAQSVFQFASRYGMHG